MHIHFVCTGNGYRSRLAEAYLKSKLVGKKIKVSSSGIATTKYRLNNGPICWYAMRIMKRQSLIPYMSWKENQTTKEILKDVDLLICMNQIHLDYCQKNIGYINKSFEIWNISDLNEMEGYISSNKHGIKKDINNIQLTEKTFKVIADKINGLLIKI